MDPLSFTASLITVTALAAASSKKIYDLRGKLNNAPKDVEKLLEQLRTFESLLKELETQLQNHRNSAPPQETLQQVWGSSVASMQQDVQSLQITISKVEPLLKKKSRSSKILLLARQILSEKEVEQYQRKIDTHCGTLTSIQAMVCSQKLDKISQSVVHLGDEDRAGFRAVSSQLSQFTSQLNTEVKTNFSTVSSQLTSTESANVVKHQEVLAHLNDHVRRDNANTEKMDEVFQRQVRSMDINEAGFQAVHSSLVTASSSSSQEHKRTHAMLSQCQGQLQQILRNHITFGTVGQSIHSLSNRPKALDPTTTETMVFWNYRCHRLPIGMLQIRLNQTRQTRHSRRSAPQVCTKSKIVVDFVPPRWLSNIAIRYSMKLSCDLIPNQWRLGATLKPLTVNHNPFFIHALKSLDVEGVRTSFATGLAKSTDYVLDYCNDPNPWYYELNRTGTFPNRLPRLCLMFESMVKDGLPGQEYLIYQLSFLHRHGDLDEQVLPKYLHDYLKHGGKILATQSSVLDDVFFRNQIGRVDWIPDCLFNSSEPWLVDDFSSLDICLIGTVANADAVFRDRLKKELASYRSPALLNRAPFVDNLFETTFGTASIESHFRALKEDEMYGFLSLLCRTGSLSMVKPFIDMGIDVNGGDYYSNLLGHAAAGGNMDVICILLEADANSSLALQNFLNLSTHLSDALFKRLLEMLVQNARPALFDLHHDPLLVILRSSRAVVSHPKAPEILLNRKAFTAICHGGGRNQNCYCRSYMFLAILARNSFAVDLLLQNGAHADTRGYDDFDCYDCYGYGQFLGSYTWITFAVMRGAASCADVLIQHGADVTALDGAGRSAIQLAWANALASYPRLSDIYFVYRNDPYRITAEEDAETLAVLERAFNLRFQGTKSLEEHIKPSDESTLQPPPRQDRLVSALQKTLQKALGILFTPTQTEILHIYLRGLHHNVRRIWSLSFYEALLMRSVYVLSYALLLALEVHAFIKGHKRIPMPSRFLLSAVALLLLGLVWDSSQVGFSWGPITTRSSS